jgi:hypothetical protein
MDDNLYIPGVVSGDLGTTSITQSTQREYQNFPIASQNSAISDINVDLLDIWSKNYGVEKTADDILNNIDALSFAPGTKAGIVGLAKLYKAWSYGFLIEAFQKISIDGGATFVDRPAALAEILRLLASAKTDVTGTTLTTDFTGSILSPNFDFLNTIRVFQARYSLAAGNYSDALGFANEVPGSASAVITFAGTCTSCCPPTAAASARKVGWPNSTRTSQLNSTWRMRSISLTASSEWPLSSKKLSSRPTLSSFNSDCQIPARVLSTAPCGAA